jgi:biotin transport system substrate-specific component
LQQSLADGRRASDGWGMTPAWAIIGKVVAAAGFAALMALSAQIAVPMVPVPMTMQSWAVLLAGAALGARWGVGSVLLYLAAAAAGLPVLSEGGSGPEPFTGPSAGYLVAFPIAAALAGREAARGRLDRPLTGWLMMTAVHLVLLAVGTAWLARTLGLADALSAGFSPFILGAMVKSALVIACLALFRRLSPSLRP